MITVVSYSKRIQSLDSFESKLNERLASCEQVKYISFESSTDDLVLKIVHAKGGPRYSYRAVVLGFLTQKEIETVVNGTVSGLDGSIKPIDVAFAPSSNAGRFVAVILLGSGADASESEEKPETSTKEISRPKEAAEEKAGDQDQAPDARPKKAKRGRKAKSVPDDRKAADE